MPLEIAADVQARVLHRCVEPAAKSPRLHAELHALAHGPVLAVYEVPEVDHVTWIEVGLAGLRYMKQQIAGDTGVIRRHRPEHESGDVLGRDAQQQIRIGDLALVMRLLGVREPRKRSARGSATHRKRPGPGPMRYAVVPFETRAPALAERRHERAEFR